jgi:hypothetical protein
MKRKPTTVETFRAFYELMSDGCTFAPDMVFYDCCVEHDIDYSTGTVNRAEADRKLRVCIRAKGYPILCWVYWLGVRLFGWVSYYFGDSVQSRKEYKLLVEDNKSDTM